jgi:hypothetical protein
LLLYLLFLALVCCGVESRTRCGRSSLKFPWNSAATGAPET